MDGVLALNALTSLYIQSASFAMLAYDYVGHEVLTFSDEVEHIWSYRPSVVSLLFAVNRYGNPLQFFAIFFMFNDPRWSREVCQRHSLFKGASSIALIGVTTLLMILRVWALYRNSRLVLAFMLFLLSCQIALSAAGLNTGFPVILSNVPIHGCIHTSRSVLFSAIWICPVITDAVAFVLMLCRKKDYRMARPVSISGVKGSLSLSDTIFRDGTMYFLAVLVSNLTNALIFFLANENLKPIAGPFNQLLTSMLVSRLVMNLRNAGAAASGPPTEIFTQEIQFVSPTSQSRLACLASPARQSRFMAKPQRGLATVQEDDDSEMYGARTGNNID
ncbi:hypothetical protein FA15DRAFT_757739 [Coprinopsis marcescibilis]|uniref:DUF6533 domain-containing protein n=1 Tax=Coprinopsis marcescibilis TaxID=230819 RepID=A0A5C3KQZ6_COPMA|nr:hypothetical protein FA15DRAFT_757739 [Coprinopsis marcescibilis]